MTERTARELVDLRIRAMNDEDWDALEVLTHPDYVEDYPQSGERIRGRANLRAIFENYPGGLRGRVETAGLYGAEERWAMAPNFSVVRVTGSSSDVLTAVISAEYPDGSHWFVISLFRTAEGMVRSSTTYFAQDFPAPEWRSPYVERIQEQ